MTVSLTTINLKKENIIHLMHFQQNVIQFGKYIYVIIWQTWRSWREKMVLELKAREKYFQKYTSLQLATAGKKMKRCTTYKTILIPKNWTTLLNYSWSAIKWDYNTFEKGLQNTFTSWMSFQLLLQLRFYNLLLHSQKMQTTCETT